MADTVPTTTTTTTEDVTPMDPWTAAGCPSSWPASPEGPEIPVFYADDYGPRLPSPPTSLGAGSSSLGFDGASDFIDGYGRYENSAPNGGSILLTIYAQDGLTPKWQGWVVGKNGLKLDDGVFAQDGSTLWGRGGGHAGVDPNRFYQRWQFVLSGQLVPYARGPQVGGVGAALIPGGGQPPDLTEAEAETAVRAVLGLGAGQTLLWALNNSSSPLYQALNHLVKNAAQVGATLALQQANVLTTSNFGPLFYSDANVERRLENAGWLLREKEAQGTDTPVGMNAPQLQQAVIQNIEHK